MAIERSVLSDQLAALPDSAPWAGRPEVEELHTLLSPGEKVLVGVTGWLIESGKLAVRTWLIVATTNRLICLLKAGSAGVRKVELPVTTMKAAYTDARL